MGAYGIAAVLNFFSSGISVICIRLALRHAVFHRFG